jgi:DNA helicase HerA-like ATPase
MSNRDVIGNLLGTTTPSEVTICIDPTIVRTSPLRLGEYLIIDYQSEDLSDPVLATVTEIGVTNLNMPDSILTSPREFEALSRIADLTDGEILTANARILGFLNEATELEIPRFSPPPGAQVSRAPVELLSQAFGRGQIRIGELLTDPEVEVRLNVNELVRRHLAILAITGAGKGNTVAVIISQLLEIGGAVVVIDPHSEYVSMRNELGDRMVSFSTSADASTRTHSLRFRYNGFTASDFLSILRIPPNAHKQRALFRNAFDELAGREWDYDDLLEALRQADDGADSEQYRSILDRMRDATEFAILDRTQEVPLDDESSPSLVNRGRITVLSLAGLDNDLQQALVRRVAQKILRGGIAWRRQIETEDQIPCPVFLVVEESHNFVPADESVPSKRVLRRIASEGRKFGVGLCVVSQRPGKIDSNVLSQCNSMIVLRVVNPRDQTNIENSAEALSKELMKELPSLNVGEAIVFGPAVNLPALVKIDRYEGTLGGEDIDIIGAWAGNNGRSNRPRRRRHDDDGALDRRDW